MAPVNWARVMAGGLLWCATYNVLTGGAWFAFLHEKGLTSFHPLLGASQAPTAGQVASAVAMTLVMGVFATWLYAAIRPRYGSSPLTAGSVGVVTWLIAGVMPSWLAIAMQAHPWGPLTAELASKLVVMTLATIAGASVYREATTV